MGQQEVYTFLRRHRNKWFSAKEIMNKLKLSQGSVSMSLLKLRKGKIIDFKLEKEITHREAYVYRFKK